MWQGILRSLVDINIVKETVDKQLVKVSDMVQGQEGWREVVKKHVNSSMSLYKSKVQSTPMLLKQAVGERPPQYAPPASSPVGAEALFGAEQTAN